MSTNSEENEGAPSALPGAAGAASDENEGKSPISTRAWGVADASSPVKEMQITRRAVGPHDVLLDVLYCGICHSPTNGATERGITS